MSQDGTYVIPEKTSIPKGSCETDLEGSCVIVRNDAGTCEQDWHKSDTADSGIVPGQSENESPEDRAGSTGADQLGISFKTEEYRKRAEASTALCLAIAQCEPEDAAPILEAALLSMTAGWPVPPLLSLMEEACTWADFATGAERKAYALACHTRMPATDRAAFLAYVTGGGDG